MFKMNMLSQLQMSPCLRARINNHDNLAPSKDVTDDGFVLYLPTVNLRFDHNPAFTVACHAANQLRVPLVVLAVVCDDKSHHSERDVVMTSRRLAFTLQALSHACQKWSEHGAAVGVRVHGPNSRFPDHLSLASNASFVVTDESFVSPFTTIVRRVREACRKGRVECISVDGSTTVPPIQVLTRNRHPTMSGEVVYEMIPQKAYLWQNKTEHLRDEHLNAAVQGEFCAPELLVKLNDEDLFHPISDIREPSTLAERLAPLFPKRWRRSTEGELPSCPGIRPFTSGELNALYHNDNAAVVGGEAGNSELKNEDSPKRVPFYNFSTRWSGADRTVPPCEQTVGTSVCGMNRWNCFIQNGGLLSYAKERNNARLVHSVTRMSAYLNLGIVSIFRLVSEVKRAQRQVHVSKTHKNSIDKFLQEIVKFREMSYAHAFSRGRDYDSVSSLPRWSVQVLSRQVGCSFCNITLKELETGTTHDAKWNAMQRYLVRTGELHNNVRMTWGKTVVGWASSLECENADRADVVLKTMCYLNDRYALDGLSPPSYAGILWCLGWTDKPDGGSMIPLKHSYLYRMTIEDFLEAERLLLSSRSGTKQANNKQVSILDMMKTQQSQGKSKNETKTQEPPKTIVGTGMKRGGSIDSFFSKTPKKLEKKPRNNG